MAMLMKGNGTFSLNIVGESYRQQSLQSLAGQKIAGGHDIDCLAGILLDERNPHDKNAVAVFIVHASGKITHVGFLARKMAVEYRKSLEQVGGQNPTGMLCRAKIVGGWNDGGGDEGLYGVKLDLELPISFRTPASWENWSKRLLPDLHQRP